MYEGWFAEGGAVGPLRNGESCLSPVPDDPLEALRVSFIERQRRAGWPHRLPDDLSPGLAATLIPHPPNLP